MNNKGMLKDCIIPIDDIKWTDGRQGTGVLTDENGEFNIYDIYSWFYPHIYLHGVLEEMIGNDLCVIYGKDLLLYIRQLINNGSMVYAVSNLNLYHKGVYRDVTLYLWHAKDSKLRDKNNEGIAWVKGLIVDSTNFADNEYARQKMIKRPLII